MIDGYRESEELEITRVEKVLVLGLIVFLLIGGFWILNRIDGSVPRPVMSQDEIRYRQGFIQGEPIEDELGIPPLRRQSKELHARLESREAVLATRRLAVESADAAYKFHREEYRTAMEAGRATPALRSAHETARREWTARQSEYRPAQAAFNATRAQMARVDRRLSDLEERAGKLFEQRNRSRNLLLLVLHFLYAGLAFLLSWMAWRRARLARWRFLSLTTALVAASVIQLVFLTFRYCWELFLRDIALLGTSLIGIAGCTLAIVALKRYVLSPERVARSRLASHACPNCSTPFENGQAHCWDCGRALVEPCPHCGETHLRHAPHCRHCGREVAAS